MKGGENGVKFRENNSEKMRGGLIIREDRRGKIREIKGGGSEKRARRKKKMNGVGVKWGRSKTHREVAQVCT